MTTAPLFGVLILNYNGRRWLPGLLDSLRGDGYHNKRVYVIDNGSGDESLEFVRARYPDVVILELRKNMGFSAAYNVAMRQAFDDGCEWVVWQNNDTLVLPGWLGRMAEVAAGDQRIGVMGPVFLAWDSDGANRFMVARHADVVPFMRDGTHSPVDCDWVEGSALAVKRACIDAIGPLEPLLFMYWEEVDFCRRARYGNWRVVIVPGSCVRHFGGGSMGQGPAHSLKLRNEFIYTLCNPTSSFAGNALRALHLFLVKMRAASRSSAPMRQAWACGTVVLKLCVSGLTWHRKWARDRRGEFEPLLLNGAERTG